MSYSRLPAPKAVLFDWDHTLVNPDGAIIAAFDATLAEMHATGHAAQQIAALSELNGQAVLANAQTRGRIIETLQEAYPEAQDEVAAVYRRHYRTATREHTALLQGTLETLHYLEQKGVPLAIISQKRQGVLEEEYAELVGSKLKTEMLLIGSDGVRPNKPAPDALHAAMQHFGIEPRHAMQVWMVGDSYYSDIAAGKAAGCTPVWFGNAPHEASKQADTKPDVAWVPNQSALKRLVQISQSVDHTRSR